MEDRLVLSYRCSVSIVYLVLVREEHPIQDFCVAVACCSGTALQLPVFELLKASKQEGFRYLLVRL